MVVFQLTARPSLALLVFSLLSLDTGTRFFFSVHAAEQVETSYFVISAMTPPAAKRRRAVEHQESVRNITVIKGGLSIMCPSVSTARGAVETSVGSEE